MTIKRIRTKRMTKRITTRRMRRKRERRVRRYTEKSVCRSGLFCQGGAKFQRRPGGNDERIQQ
jgi:hypothetical protein